MSDANVETVRASFEAWNRGDREGWMAAAHPEVEWSSAIVREVEGADATVYRGRAGVERFWNEWHALWNVMIQPTEMRDLGDSVLALATFRAGGGSSGVDLEQAIGYVFEFEGDLIKRATAYIRPDDALAAVGLSE
jgi:ketosteroid isomerase-like protein